MSEPTPSRAVLSTADFDLLREAVVHYIKTIENDPKSVKFAQLYHRLGSAARKKAAFDSVSFLGRKASPAGGCPSAGDTPERCPATRLTDRLRRISAGTGHRSPSESTHHAQRYRQEWPDRR